MNWADLLAAPLRSLAPYRPGMTEETLRQERGLTKIFKFSSNEIPFSPSASVLAAMHDALAQANRYPDPHAFLKKLSSTLSVPVESIVLGNGSIDIISALVKAFVSSEHNVVLSEYGYCAYPSLVTETGAAIRLAPSGPDFGHDVDQLLDRIDADTRMLIIDSPTNLSGKALAGNSLRQLVERLPVNVLLVLDEAYVEFSDEFPSLHSEQFPLNFPNVIVTRTFSKAYGLAGLRIGYGIANAGLIDILNRIRPPFPVNRIALAGALAALDDSPRLRQIVRSNRDERIRLTNALGALGIPTANGSANFVLAKFGPRTSALYESLLARGFITRLMTAYALPDYLRISIGAPHEIDLLLKAITSLSGASSTNIVIGASA